MNKRLFSQRGQALIEFAMVLSLLLLLVLGLFDVGTAVYSYNVIASAAREGARYGITHPNDSTGIRNTARANTAVLDPSRVTVSSNCSPNCNNGSDITVTVSYTFRPITMFFTPLTFTSRATMMIEAQ